MNTASAVASSARIPVLQAQLAISRIANLDLNEVQAKLVNEEGMSPDSAATVMADYRRFLTIIALYPGVVFAPSKAIDAAWHQHILFTRQYHADCSHIFGYYLHHAPNPSDGSGREQVLAGFGSTRWAFQVEFGREVEDAPANSCVECGPCTYGCVKQGGD